MAGRRRPRADDRAGGVRVRRPVRSGAARRGLCVRCGAVSVDVLTFGCRLNTYESEVIRRHADAAGLADVVIVNTCVVTGCAAQTSPERFAAMAEVDRVVGNDGKITAQAWSATATELARASDFGVSREQKIVVNDILSVRETAAHLVE